MYCFFFSSRRRHTRLVSDWSSDVCSSDLCGLDPRRVALTGSEMRACWTVPDPVLETERESPAVAAHRAPATLAGDRLPRTFVPVDELVAGGPGSATPASAPPVAGSPSARSPMAAPSARGDRV